MPLGNVPNWLAKQREVRANKSGSCSNVLTRKPLSRWFSKCYSETHSFWKSKSINSNFERFVLKNKNLLASTQLAGNVITSKFIQNEKKKYITIIWDVKRQIIDMGSEKQNSSDTTAVIQEKLKKAKSTPPLVFF